MHFLNASALYLLAFIPIVALLHFLKLRRQRHVVPSIMLWLEAIEDVKANVPFQRLRNSLLLILQLLFLLIAVATVARPALRRPSSLQGQSILILENSASMQSTELGESRFEIARTKALALIDRLDTSSQMMIMDTSRPPHHIHQGFTADKEKLRRAISEMPLQHISPDLKAIFNSVRAYINGPSTGIFFIGDGFEAIPNSSHHLQNIGVGEQGENVGIVQFDASLNPNQPGQFQVLVVIQNFGLEEQKFRVRLEIGGKWLDDETLSLRAGETQSIVFSVEDKRFDGLIVSARLELEDDLALDNAASAILHSLSKSRVLLVSDRHQPLLTKMLEADVNIDLVQIQTQDYQGMGGRDIVIFDQYVPEDLPDANTISLNPVDGLQFMPVEQKTELVHVIDQERTHAIMRDVSLINLQVKESLIPQLPIWGIPLVETTHAPLIWFGEHAKRKVVVFAFDAFDLQISRFALLIPSAPIFMSRCLEWLSTPKTPIQPDVVKVGTPVRIVLDHLDEVDSIAVELPDGSRTNIVAQSATIVFADTSHVGVYTVSVDNRRIGQFFVNLLNRQESNISAPQRDDNQREAGSIEEHRVSHTQQVNREVWKYTACLGLFLLVMEWWLYHRNR